MANQASRSTFYVTGLPRSRTSWLSVVLSDWHQSACLHEPLARISFKSGPDGAHPSMESLDNLAGLRHMLDATRCPFAGISDSGLPVVAPDLPSVLPGPLVIVWRDPVEVARSLSLYLGGDPDAHLGAALTMQSLLETFAARYDHLSIDFEELDDIETIRKIWTHLLPGVRFQRRRVESLMRMQIEPVRTRLLEGLTESAEARAREAMAAAVPTDA